MRTLLSSLLFASFFFIACTPGTAPTGGGTTGGGTAGSGGTTGGGGDAGMDGGIPQGTTSYTLSVGLEPDGGVGCVNGICPLSVQAGTQIVYCTYMHLGNPAPIEVIGFTSTQSLGGH